MLRRIAAANLRSHHHPPTHPFSTTATSNNNNNTHHTSLLSLLSTSPSFSPSHLAQIQSQFTTSGLLLLPIPSSRLIASSPSLPHSLKLLSSLPNPNPFSFNITLRRLLDTHHNNNPSHAINLYKQMFRLSGFRCRPDNYTYPLLFKACAQLSSDRLGFQVLCHVVKMGFDGDVFVINGMVSMLVCCGAIGDARKVFDESPVRDLVTWNSLINGYAQNGMGREALRVFGEMEGAGVVPDEVTMIGVVSACAGLEDLERGRGFHGYVGRSGVRLTVRLCNALMDMYVKCGDLDAARGLFDGMGGKKSIVSWTTMVVGYAKFRMLDDAREMFDRMPEKDVVPWNAMIGGYAQGGHGKEALALFTEMQAAKVRPDEVTMVNCLSACSQIGALDIGVWIHRYIERNKLFLNVALGTALVDMYVKCANIGKALHVFHRMSSKNALTWTVMIGGLALHGNAHEAISYFSKMVETGLVPDEVTYLGILSACCHGGLVDEGRAYFSEMSSKYKLTPKLKHYSCMVDLLGRAGLLDEAEAVIRSMPIEPDAVVWGALFFACRMHGNVLMGEKAALKLLELDPGDSGIYVLLANMYGDADMWEQAKRVRKMMAERGVEKTPGCSAIEVNGIVNEFIVRDKSHPRSKEIYGCLIQLTKQMALVENISRAKPVEWDPLFSC